MSRKKNILMASACIVLGMALAGPTAHAAEEVLTAVRSTHQPAKIIPTAFIFCHLP